VERRLEGAVVRTEAEEINGVAASKRLSLEAVAVEALGKMREISAATLRCTI